MKSRILTEDIVNNFSRIIESDCSEEKIHQFLNTNRELLECLYSPFTIMYEDFANAGIISKFPITQDRIPDFTLYCIQKGYSNIRDEILFIELKKPSAQLYGTHGRMSKSLNDAWGECIASLHLIGINYQDFIRRIEKIIQKDISNIIFRHFPIFKCIILIGRRSQLTKEEIDRVHEISSTTSQTIRIMTYDSLLEININRLKDIERIVVNADKEK